MPARDGFDFDQPPSPGTNRHAADNGCPTCHGDRLVPVSEDENGPYARCMTCNAPPQFARQPVDTKAWWKE